MTDNRDIPPRKPSVLLGFSASNARSFKDEFSISLLATRQSESAAVFDVPWREGGHPLSVLPTIGLFGPNASGKTNVLRVLDDMRHIVVYGFRQGDPSSPIERVPFRLSAPDISVPTRYEIDMILEGVRHVYGFEVDDEKVIEEWAFRYPKGKAASIFHRDADLVTFPSGEKAKSRHLTSILRPNALVLSTAASANHEGLLPLYMWFSRNLLLADVESRRARQLFTARLLAEESPMRPALMRLLKAADLGVADVVQKDPEPVIQERLQRAVRNRASDDPEHDVDPDLPLLDALGIALTHKGQDEDLEFAIREESLGTLVWLGLIGPVLSALEDGAVLLADEIDASLHPELTSALIRLFQSPDTNPNRAQLIFNSHDITMFGNSQRPGVLGRDQIWFTEKTSDGSTRLYSLADFSPRKDEAIAARYMAGRYGAKPILDELALSSSNRDRALGSQS